MKSAHMHARKGGVDSAQCTTQSANYQEIRTARRSSIVLQAEGNHRPVPMLTYHQHRSQRQRLGAGAGYFEA